MSILLASGRRAAVAAHQQTLVPALSSRYLGSVKRKEKKSKGDGSRPRDLEVILAALDAPSTKPPTPDQEELERREKVRRAYTIGKFKQHNEENHDIACKLKLKKHAMNMLPRKSSLKAKALEIDTKGPPRWRTIPAWTPPIPDFDPSKFTLLEE